MQRTSHAAFLAQTWGGLVRDRRVSGSAVRQEAALLARNVHGFWTGVPWPKGEQGYDICDDQALPSLQTATNQKSAHRHSTVRLRKACLAGVVAYAHNTPFGLSFRFVQVTSRDKALSQTQTQE